MPSKIAKLAAATATVTGFLVCFAAVPATHAATSPVTYATATSPQASNCSTQQQKDRNICPDAVAVRTGGESASKPHGRSGAAHSMSALQRWSARGKPIHSARLALSSPPPTPRGGTVVGPFVDEADCQAYLAALGPLPPGIKATCYRWDGDGNWYLIAWPQTDLETWLNANSGLAVEVYHSSTADLATVDQWPYNGSLTQWWLRIETPSGGYNLINGNSGKCLGVRSASTSVKAPVVQYTCNGSYDQVWYFSFTGQYSGIWPEYLFVNRNSGLCLDVPYLSTSWGTALWQYPCNGTGAQRFY